MAGSQRHERASSHLRLVREVSRGRKGRRIRGRVSVLVIQKAIGNLFPLDRRQLDPGRRGLGQRHVQDQRISLAGRNTERDRSIAEEGLEAPVGRDGRVTLGHHHSHHARIDSLHDVRCQDPGGRAQAHPADSVAAGLLDRQIHGRPAHQGPGRSRISVDQRGRLSIAKDLEAWAQEEVAALGGPHHRGQAVEAAGMITLDRLVKGYSEQEGRVVRRGPGALEGGETELSDRLVGRFDHLLGRLPPLPGGPGG